MDKINQYSVLLGNFGIVVGLVFLIVEIQSNTRAMEGQTRDAMTERVVNWHKATFESGKTNIISTAVACSLQRSLPLEED